MKRNIFLLLAFGFFSCKEQVENHHASQGQVDSLESRIADAYKPGLGEFMGSMQIHHNKLWFAGKNENWKLADFEIHEIRETVEAIEKYQQEREESKKVGMIYTALDSLDLAIQQKDPAQFRNSYILLTETCNNCHRDTKFEFNVVKLPEAPAFSNQEYKLLPK